jgi:large subunit ribosomal protein L28
MAYKCQISGKQRQVGNRVSHANNHTKRVFKPNLQSKRIYIPSEKRLVRVFVSTQMLRTIDKIGIECALRSHGMTVADLKQ